LRRILGRNLKNARVDARLTQGPHRRRARRAGLDIAPRQSDTIATFDDADGAGAASP